jgi:tRNA(Ile)-lysidine synthase
LPEVEFSAPAHSGKNSFVGDKIVIITEKICDWDGSRGIVNNNLTINCIDCGKIQGDIVLRNRRNGDRIQLCGNNFHSRLKKLLNRDVPLEERSAVAVLSDANG